jgi:hypothetical protein
VPREPSRTRTLRYAAAWDTARSRSSFLAPTGAGLSAFSGHPWQRLPGAGVTSGGVKLKQPLSTFLLVLSILAVVLGIFLLQSGYAWLVYSHRPPPTAWWVFGALSVGYVMLRMIWKRR